ncbi:MAG: hypothetical protein REJ24_07970 [Rhodocyclaceae bacterium]|nr:hypothetical protein [Pseudomonadota bacterium]MDQ7972489.1 hypothetical protein [Rhodocyclaceae bacterium]MDQ8000769.1 hypothetical protein [Pseudomonadota bacterium]MDQ8020091.1 hypothetical protein [Pseudomonadota bacterium]
MKRFGRPLGLAMGAAGTDPRRRGADAVDHRAQTQRISTRGTPSLRAAPIPLS